MSANLDPERDASNSDGPRPAKLLKFRQMTGIKAPPRLALDHPERPGPNMGIYTRVIREERSAKFEYRLMSSIINMSFFVQIVVGATLTALGATNASHTAITVLGSVNTVIAGIQTYLKGQGLPNRIRQYQFSLRKLREHIEDREREFADHECMLDVDFVIADVAAMYQAVRQTAEDNLPDVYLPISGAGKKLLGQKDTPDATDAPVGKTGLAQPVVVQPGAVHPGADAAANADALAAAENAKAKEAKGKEKTNRDAGKDSSNTNKAVDGEGSGTTKPNREDDTEDAPLLKKTDAKG